ncbi:MAG: regulatory signaling modulator protein AmpE [Pseudomonadota bacterium]|nr:regulatory signaling modulator protein AmpE [Pseudomonadota bacterium]
MTLISVLLGIAADRLLTHLHDYRHYHYFLHYVDWMRGRLHGPAWDHFGGLLIVLLPVWLTVGWLQLWISDWLFGLIGLLFYITVFVYCLGPRDLAVDVDTWCEVCESDADLRSRAASRLLKGDEALLDEAESGRQITEAVLVEANERLFAVLFWFVLLGPLGAVVYRSVAVLYQQRREQGELGDSIAWLYSLVVWLPARLLALGYALSGHFDAAIAGWRRAHQDYRQGPEGSRQLLAMTGSGALGPLEDAGDEDSAQSPVRAAMRLVWRTLMIWLVIISVLTLAGWAG